MASNAAPLTPPGAFSLGDSLAAAAEAGLLPQQAQQQQQSQPALPAQQVGASGLIDTRAIGKLKSFSGAAWVFVARGYLNLLDTSYQALIQAAENANRYSDLILSDMGQHAQEKAIILFNLLTQSVDGRALQVLMNVENGNGFQAWKALCEAYEPDVGGRHTAMLMSIIAPAWENRQGERLPGVPRELGSADKAL